jgi:hypothetical protein
MEYTIAVGVAAHSEDDFFGFQRQKNQQCEGLDAQEPKKEAPTQEGRTIAI